MNRKKILLIDDDEELAAISSKILTNAGYKVATASNGASGFDFLLKDLPDLVLLDMVLPDCTGLELLERIKSNPELSQVYIIILSGQITESEIQTKAIQTGADGYLVKPIQNRELVARIDSAFRHINTIAELKKKEIELTDLNQKIEEQYNSLLKSNEQLKDTQIASLNLMSDLKTEIEVRKKAETDSLNSQKYLSTLINTIPDLVWLKDINGIFITCNTIFEKLYGANVTEIVGKSDYDFVDKDLADFFRENDRKSIQTNKPSINEEWLTFASDGHKALHETIKTPMYDSLGNIIGVLGIARDITERKEAENELRKSEEKFRNLVESINEVFYTSDKNGKLTYISPNISLLTGFTSEEVIDKSYLKFVSKQDQRKVISHYLKVSSNKVTDTSFEFRIRTKDGKTIWAGQLTHIVYDDAGNIVEYRNVARDITERKVVEEELRISREEFKAYFNSSSVGLSVTAHDKSWIEVNQKLCDMMGYTKEELINVTWVSLTHPDDIAVNIELFNKATEGKIDSYSLDKRFVRKNGKIIYATISTTVQRNLDGSIHHLLTSYTDITLRKEAELLLAETEERYRKVFEQSPYGVVIMDPDKMLPFDFNDVAHLQLGFTRSEFANKKISDYEIIENANETKARIDNILKEGKDEFVTKHKTKDGDIRDIFVSVQRIRVAGKPLLYTIFQDITERKQAEEKVKESEIKFRSVWEKSTDGMRITNEDGLVILVNNAYCKLVEKSLDEVEMKPMSIVYQEERYDDILNKHRERFRAYKIPPHSETTITLWNGKNIFLELSNTFLDVPNQPILLLTVFRDVTERKIAEVNLKQSEEKLRALTARLEKVKEEERISLSRDLHDNLGQNLTGLKMEIAYFAKKIKTERFANPDDLLEKSNSMLGLIDEMINNVRKISAELRPNVLDYLGLIPAIEWQISELMKRTEIKAELKCSLQKIDFGVLKNSSIFRIVQEAFTNIIRHANANKVIVSIMEDEDYYDLEIYDNGVGINEEAISNSQSLGVIGMKERTLQFNGKMSLQNSPNGGTLLTLIIPKTVN